MKQIIAVSAIGAVFILASVSRADAWREKEAVTPYGDFCPRCSQYGNCKSTMSHEDAKEALIDYYHRKGLNVQVENKHGRFIRAKISDQRNVVDVIIFDRRTGRIRSIN